MACNLLNLNILFMGTPDFASTALEYLHKQGACICGVVTQPDKPKGRGNKLCPSAVKSYAMSESLPVYQPETMKNEAFLPVLQELKPDLIVVVAYGKILPEYILSYPKYGCINLHGSLLPKYRGAAPIQRAVLDGEKETGLTTMLMDKGLDTGDMLLRQSLEIGENDTTEMVFDNLAKMGGPLLCKTIEGICDGSIVPVKQDESCATYAEKLTEKDEKTDFSMPALSVHNKIRGLSSFPGAFAILDGKKVKFYNSSVFDGNIPENHVAGQVFFPDKKSVAVVCGDGKAVVVSQFKPEGKGVITAADMINGRKLNNGDIFQ